MPLERLTAASSLKDTIQAAPTKNFFVNMLTRDIELEDAILDLLDNCTDGIQRALQKRDGDDRFDSYDGFKANVTIEKGYFKIEDNCGGISIDRAKNFAFRMGRPTEASDLDDDLYTIGTYGIGMKRAIFKMGRLCRVTSQTESEAFEVAIPPEWFSKRLVGAAV